MSLESIETSTVQGTSEAVLPLARSWLADGCGVALATVVETWGTAPRPAGAMLAVNEDGRFEGSVSGGCIEGAVIKEAQDVIKEGTPKSLTFGVSDEQAWEVGLTCGGEITVWIRKIPSAQYIDDLTASIPTALIFNLETGEEWSLSPTPDLSATVIEAAQDALKDDKSRRLVDTPYFIQAFNRPLRMIVVGAVHITQTLAPMAQMAGFQVTVIDPRKAYATAERFPGVALSADWPDDAMKALNPDERTAVVLLCHDSKIDDPGLSVALKSNAYYIGALGSRRTQEKRRARMLEQGFTEHDLKRISGPVGLDLGGRSHAEIAVSILSEAIAVRHGKNLRNDV